MKTIIHTVLLAISILLLSSCDRFSDDDLTLHFNSHPLPITIFYDEPLYILHSVPEQLPFPFGILPNGKLLGTVLANGQKSGTILLEVDQNASDILEYYTNLLTDVAFSDINESHNYQVFFPPEESGATFCSEQGIAIFLEIFGLENGLKDVRLHYTSDAQVIEHTTCGQPTLDIENFPFPHLTAPPNSSVLGGGGGGGGSGKDTRQGSMGYLAEITINSDDSLEAVYNHYKDLLVAQGWILLNQNSTDRYFECNWDFGFYETRSWLARLTVSVGESPNQYIIILRAISP
jgi:hypothetical protein